MTHIQSDHRNFEPGDPAPSAPRYPRSVAFVAPFGLGQKTTVWARILPLAQHLARRGIDSTLLIPPWDTPAHSGLRWEDEGVTVDNVRLSGGPPLILARLLRRIQRRQPDIIHIVKPTAYAGAIQTLLWTFRRLTGTKSKIVLDVDDWEQAWAELNRRSYFMRRLIGAQENWGLGHADGVTAASHWLIKQVNHRAPQMPSCYLPNGIIDQNPDFVTDQMPQSAPVVEEARTDKANDPQAHEPGRRRPDPAPGILYFTRFIEIEPAWLAEFSAALFELHPGAVLHIAGSGVRPELESRFKETFNSPAIQAYTSQGRIQWLGHVRQESLASLYESCVCAIFPSQETTVHQAKCSVKLATTLLHGIPTVASAVGEQRAYGEAGGVRLLPSTATPQAFAGAVAEILSEPATQMHRQAQNRAALLTVYNWRNLGERLLTFYQSLAG